MNENLITALEAAWELDPVRLENKLWRAVEELSNKDEETLVSCGSSSGAK